MNLRTIFIFIAFLSFNSTEANELKCSLKGTHVYTINGVLTSGEDARFLAEKVAEALDKPSRYDKRVQINTFPIPNESFGFTGDLLELVAQNYRSNGGKEDPWKYIGAALHNVKSLFPIQAIGLEGLNAVSGMLAGQSLSKLKLSPETLQMADYQISKTVEYKVKKALDEKRKVIVVAHSQGNSVTNTAMTALSTHSNFKNDYMPYLGVLHIAPPTPNRVIGRSEKIKLYEDLVVSNPLMLQFSEEPNYIGMGYDPDSPIVNIFSSIVSRITGLESTDFLNHGMIKTYLNRDKFIKPLYSNEIPKSARTVFQDQMEIVAKKLEDNCIDPIIKIKSPIIIADPITGLNKLDVYAKSQVVLDLFDDNKDNYDSDKTEFSWVLRHLSGSTEILESREGIGKNIDFYLPYNDITYELTITAENELGKETTQKFNFVVAKNNPPTLTETNRQCNVREDGSSSGDMTITYRVKDDSYQFDNLTKFSGVGYRASNYDIEEFDNFSEKGTLTVTNTCPYLTQPVKYEIWATCQTEWCSRNDPDRVCDYYINTGIQWNDLLTYDLAGNLLGSNFLSEGLYGYSESRTFKTSSEPPVYLNYETANACPGGQQVNRDNRFKLQ